MKTKSKASLLLGECGRTGAGSHRPRAAFPCTTGHRGGGPEADRVRDLPKETGTQEPVFLARTTISARPREVSTLKMQPTTASLSPRETL